MLLKVYFFEPYKTDGLIDLILVSFLILVSLIIYMTFAYIIFREFFEGILNTIRKIKKVK